MIKKLNVLLLLYFYVFKLQYLSQAPKLFFSCTHIKLESGYITCKKEKKLLNYKLIGNPETH